MDQSPPGEYESRSGDGWWAVRVRVRIRMRLGAESKGEGGWKEVEESVATR